MMEGYPHGLLAIPSDGYSGQRIVVPVDEQKALIKCVKDKKERDLKRVLLPLER